MAAVGLLGEDIRPKVSWLDTGNSCSTTTEYAQHLNDKKIYKVLMGNLDLLVPRVQELNEAMVFKGSLMSRGWK